jgi:hypothetical protein
VTMATVPESLRARLDRLKSDGRIAGWQDAGGPNYGLATKPLPALIFPINEGPAVSAHDPEQLDTLVSLLERFGPAFFFSGSPSNDPRL